MSNDVTCNRCGHEAAKRRADVLRALMLAMAATASCAPGGGTAHVNELMAKAVAAAPFEWRWDNVCGYDTPADVVYRISAFAEACAEWEEP